MTTRVHAPAHDLRWHGDREVAPGLIDLAVNVRVPTPYWLTTAIGAIDLTRYPDQADARFAVAGRHGRDATEVLLTAGAAEAFVLLARALRPTRAVVVHPSFTEPEVALMTAGHPVERVVLPEPFTLDPAVIPEYADLVVLGNPTNPTSVLHPREVIADLVRPGRIIVVDEAFADCVPGESQSLAGRADLSGVIVVRSLTKTWGLAGLRIGYVLAAPDLIERLAAEQPRWPVSSPALAAAVACSQPAAVAEAEQRAAALTAARDYLVQALADLPGVTVVPDPAASFLLLHTPRPDLRIGLRTAGFAVRRGETFPGLDEHWIRVAVRDTETSIRFREALRGLL